MCRFIIIALLILTPSAIQAESKVSVPWEEFRLLYEESIEKKLAEQNPDEKEPQVYSIEESVYHLKIDGKKAAGEINISGKIISGSPEPIPLFQKEMVIGRIEQVTGGSLLCTQDAEREILFLPSDTGDFNIRFTFFLRIHEDKRSQFMNFHIPGALKNVLNLETGPEIELVENPGIIVSPGIFNFSSRPELMIRFAEKKEASEALHAKVDILTNVRLSDRRLILESTFSPDQPLPASYLLEAPEGYTLLSSSLKNSFIKKADIKKSGGNSYRLDPGRDTKLPFRISFISEKTKDSSRFSFSLPSIKGNNGKERNFIIEQPDEGQMSLSDESAVPRIPVSRLGQLKAAAQEHPFFMRMPPGKKIQINIKRFRQIHTPPVVLDSMSFFTSFEENGSVMSVLVMDIPNEAGSRIALKSVPGAEIWSLKVNDRVKKVYGEKSDSWIIPLSPGETSHVELAFIRKGEKLGLSGRLDTFLPATGLPSRQILAGIALPERVQLLSLEGPVSPAGKVSAKAPAEFIGRPYYFSQSFYKGNGMEMAVSYKEPVKKQ